MKIGLNSNVIVPALQLTGVFGAAILTGYTVFSSFENQGNEVHFVTNNGQVVKVDGHWLGLAWGWNDKIQTVPDTVHRIIEAQDLRVFSAEGEPFEGGIIYSYRYKSDDADYFNPELLQQYQNFIDQYANRDGRVTYYPSNEPFKDSFDNALLNVARAEFSSITSEEYRDKEIEIRQAILTALQEVIDESGFPIEIVSLNMNGIDISQGARNRISQNLSITRQSQADPDTPEAESFDFVINFDEFFIQMQELEYSRSEAMEAYCLKLADEASREGRDFSVECLRDNQAPIME